ncbi:MAG: GNAT family N-acetyltransferase [Taibaiella sp.]|nr:GNAT family N-acetyltransferase [Taibaiella sp.]
MSEYIIRPAVIEDCPRMMELVQELAVFERAPDEVTVTLQHFEESGFGKQPVWWAYVAVADNTVVGFALYYVRYSTWKGQRMYLEDLLVTDDYRRKGIGRLLMDALVIEAKKKNFTGIIWQVLHWNEPAIKFYERYHPKFDNEWVNVSVDI